MTELLGPDRSLINVTDAEWRTREINVMSLVRSFLSQISPGQDLTKISLPSVLCHPFSMLELISHREMLLFHILFELDTVTDPLERFMIVVKWFIALTRSETMEKKPFNPVIGETHLCWVENAPDDMTEFISEQVSHHPPVSAFFVRNQVHNISIEGAAWFGVKLSTNSATVSTSGPVTITTDNEVFELTKCVPDLSICNTVMPGKKYIMWTGEVKISCPQSGYVAVINTEEKYYRTNAVNGYVFHRDDPNRKVYQLDGVCGQKTTYWSPDRSRDKLTLLEHSQYKEAYIQYVPKHLRPELDSLRLWVPVVDAIIKNDMATADTEKKKIEANQRIRQAEKLSSGKENEGTYFRRDPDSLNANWQFRNNIVIMEFLKQPPPVQETQPTDIPSPVGPISDPVQDQSPPKIEADNTNDGILSNVGKNDTSVSPSIPIPPTADNPIDSSNIDISTSPSTPPEHFILDDKNEVDLKDDPEKRRSKTNGSEQGKAHDELIKKKKEVKKREKEIVKKALELKGGLISPQDIIKTGIVKMRNSFKQWNPRYVILTEGRLIYFTNQAEAEREICRGIVLLQNCYVTERPSKKDGFCIKIFNTLNHPIYSRQDLRGRPLNKPLGVSNYCLLRLKSTEEGKDWLNHLVKATPAFDQTKALAVKVDDSDSSDGPDDADESDDHNKGSSQEEPAPASPSLSNTGDTVIVSSSPAVRSSSPVSRNRGSRNMKKTESSKSKSPMQERNEPRNVDLIRISHEAPLTSGITSNELKDALISLRSSLREELNKVIESKLEDQSKNLGTKIATTEARLAYSIRSPAPVTIQPVSSSSHGGGKKNMIQNLKSQVSLNTILLAIIIYLLLSIIWML